jgi:dienelactone hydrolase
LEVRGFIVMVAAIGLASRAVALQAEHVTIASEIAGKGPFTAELFRPEGPGPFPAVVALHGCGGLFARDGKLRARETDWAGRLVEDGYLVLFPDSFTARGLKEICTSRSRSIFPRDRADDAAAAAQWLARQPFVDARRLALMGWSHGAMTVLWTVRPGFMREGADFQLAIAFYPGCRQIARDASWRPRLPLTLLVGGADDWTDPGPCRALARRTGFTIIEYPGAYHGFDAPNSPVRLRKGLGAVKGGEAHVGTDPAARAGAIREAMSLLAAALKPH